MEPIQTFVDHFHLPPTFLTIHPESISKMLLERGADPLAKAQLIIDGYESPAILIMALVSSEKVPLVQMLLEHGVEIKNHAGRHLD